jgi:hypothetical protein
VTHDANRAPSSGSSELGDRLKVRLGGDLFHPVGRMASPNGYCRTRDRFEMVRPR